MKNLFIALAVLVAVGCTKSETEQGIDLAEQQRVETILTAHYWKISNSTILGYNSEPEISLIYQYKENGELWTGYDYDFLNSTHKAATWTLTGNNLSETWPHLGKTFIQDITFISDEKLIFQHYNAVDGTKTGTRTYTTVDIQ